MSTWKGSMLLCHSRVTVRPTAPRRAPEQGTWPPSENISSKTVESPGLEDQFETRSCPLQFPVSAQVPETILPQQTPPSSHIPGMLPNGTQCRHSWSHRL